MGALKEGDVSQNDGINQLKQQLHEMQLEIDILKETLTILKKDPGANLEALKNKEKAVMVDALKSICTAFFTTSDWSFQKQLLLPKSA